MKKTIIGIAGIAFAAVIFFTNNISSDNSKLDLLLQNAEALATPEDLAKCIINNCCWSPGLYCDYDCEGEEWTSSNMKKC